MHTIMAIDKNNSLSSAIKSYRKAELEQQEYKSDTDYSNLVK